MNVTSKLIDLHQLRLRVFAPAAGSSPRPAVLAWSDIFQHTGPHVRLCTRIASYGFTVIAPELYGRIEPPGTVLRFEEDRQRALDDSAQMKLEWFDQDIDTTLRFASAEASELYACGWCIGGHLAFRAALRPAVKKTVCFYATGLHTDSLGAASGTARSLAAAPMISGDLLLVWGSRDPHIPADGRQKIHRALADAGAKLQTRTYDAEHTFMRDEGPRWQPRAADDALRDMMSLFQTP